MATPLEMYKRGPDRSSSHKPFSFGKQIVKIVLADPALSYGEKFAKISPMAISGDIRRNTPNLRNL